MDRILLLCMIFVVLCLTNAEATGFSLHSSPRQGGCGVSISNVFQQYTLIDNDADVSITFDLEIRNEGWKKCDYDNKLTINFIPQDFDHYDLELKEENFEISGKYFLKSEFDESFAQNKSMSIDKLNSFHPKIDNPRYELGDMLNWWGAYLIIIYPTMLEEYERYSIKIGYRIRNFVLEQGDFKVAFLEIRKISTAGIKSFIGSSNTTHIITSLTLPKTTSIPRYLPQDASIGRRDNKWTFIFQNDGTFFIWFYNSDELEDRELLFLVLGVIGGAFLGVLLEHGALSYLISLIRSLIRRKKPTRKKKLKNIKKKTKKRVKKKIIKK